eukprot:1869986-Rhodomonas_salina.2
MDGWMDGWVDGRKDGRNDDGWMGDGVDGRLIRHVAEWGDSVGGIEQNKRTELLGKQTGSISNFLDTYIGNLSERPGTYIGRGIRKSL